MNFGKNFRSVARKESRAQLAPTEDGDKRSRAQLAPTENLIPSVMCKKSRAQLAPTED